MIEKISLEAFKLRSNHLLVLTDPNYDVHVLQGPNGTKIELKLIYTGETAVNAFSISGRVVGLPSEWYYFDKSAGDAMSQREFASNIKASSGVLCERDVVVRDKVYYNYNVQLNCEEEDRLLDVEGIGICMLIAVDSLFGVEREAQLVPTNGWVFIRRDKPNEMSPSGLLYIPETAQDAYEKNAATVIAASVPAAAYLDGGCMSGEAFAPGDRVLIDRRFGHPIAYETHAGELKNIEVVQDKHILAHLEPA